jgi:hypothetical protein
MYSVIVGDIIRLPNDLNDSILFRRVMPGILTNPYNLHSTVRVCEAVMGTIYVI